MLALEALGGLMIFFARLAWGTTPGEALHVIAGVLLVPPYVLYQWQHWTRVRPVRARLDYGLGILSAVFMVATLATGLGLGAAWWRSRTIEHASGAVPYAPVLSAAHNIGTMLVLTFFGAHLIAVLARDARSRRG